MKRNQLILIAVSLLGPALTVLSNISPGYHGDYNILLTALNKRFAWACPLKQVVSNSTEKESAQKRRDYGRFNLAQEVECLTT